MQHVVRPMLVSSVARPAVAVIVLRQEERSSSPPPPGRLDEHSSCRFWALLGDGWTVCWPIRRSDETDA